MANFNANSGEFQVNTHTTDQQSNPTVTALNDGGFVVTWEGYFGQDDDYIGIYGQIYDASGNPTGSEFRVNTYTTYRQENPSVVGLSNGGFVVTWQGIGQDCPEFWQMDIYGQIYDASGIPTGSEFRVNTYTTGSQWGPSVTALSDGGFVVTWYGSGQQDEEGSNIYGQCYDADGTPTGSEFLVNTYSTGVYSSATALSDGGFVVTWTSSTRKASGVILAFSVSVTTPTVL